MARNEVDIIARRGDLVAFVEVKSRSGLGYGHPLEAIDSRKRGEIARVAEAWIERFGEPGLEYRFDAVAVEIRRGDDVRLEHVENAWGV